MSAADIDARVREALTKDTAAAHVDALLAEVEANHAATDLAHSEARARALDPLALPEAVTTARAQSEGLAFDLDRRTAQIAALAARSVVLHEAERAAGVRADYEAAKTERDEIAGLVRNRYPALAEELADIARRIRASDKRIAGLPGGEQLESAEAVGRGCPGHFRNGYGGPIARITDVFLPSVDGEEPPIYSPRAA